MSLFWIMLNIGNFSKRNSCWKWSINLNDWNRNCRFVTLPNGFITTKLHAAIKINVFVFLAFTVGQWIFSWKSDEKFEIKWRKLCVEKMLQIQLAEWIKLFWIIELHLKDVELLFWYCWTLIVEKYWTEIDCWRVYYERKIIR